LLRPTLANSSRISVSRSALHKCILQW